MIPSSLKTLLIQLAYEKHGPSITPCSGKATLNDCFSEFLDKGYLYYNTPDNSTRVVSCKLEPPTSPQS